MGSCLQSEQGPSEAGGGKDVEMDRKIEFPTINNQYTNSAGSSNRPRIFGNKSSNTITALENDHTLTVGDGRRNSFASTTKTILTDQDLFSREAIRVAHQFWNDNLLILPVEKRQEIGVTLYAQMFRKMPECRKIFLRGDIEATSEKFFGMIGWLIMELHSANNEVWTKIQVLGKMHKKWGISFEHYLPMLQAFHITFQEQFPKLYTLRVKFCIENLFMNAAKIMTEKDFVTLFAERVQDLESLEFLDSLDACLAHKTGREYFERYLEQTFCAEYVSFLRAFDEFKQIGNSQQRYEKGREIYLQNFDVNCEAPIDLVTDEQRGHLTALLAELDEFQSNINSMVVLSNTPPPAHGAEDTPASVESPTLEVNTNTEVLNIELGENILDALYTDVKKIIEDNSWDKFHAGIYSIKQATRIKSF